MVSEEDSSAGKATSRWRGLVTKLGALLAKSRQGLIRGLVIIALVGDLTSHYLMYAEHHLAALSVKILATACDLLARWLKRDRPRE